jgi:hypothetical protein
MSAGHEGIQPIFPQTVISADNHSDNRLRTSSSHVTFSTTSAHLIVSHDPLRKTDNTTS